MAQELRTMIQSLPKHNFKGVQASLMYHAACHYIRSTCSSSSNLSMTSPTFDSEVLAWKVTLHNAYGSKDPVVRTEAALACNALSKTHDLINDFKTHLSSLETSTNSALRQGICEMFGEISYDTYEYYTLLPIILKQLMKLTGTVAGITGDPECRRAAVKSIKKICSRLDSMSNPMTLEQISVVDIIENLLVAVQDYSIDSRGDVGSWVRAEAVAALGVVLRSIRPKISIELTTRIVSSILQQCIGKIDNLRVASVQVLYVLLAEFGEEGNFAGLEPLRDAICDAKQHLEVDIGTQHTFHSLVSVLDIQEYRASLFRELCVTAGSGGESTVIRST